MSNQQEHPNKFEKLREKAERLILSQSKSSSETPSDILDLIHELRIQQAELEIQNEELQRAQGELFELHQEYENLYEFAPCGYITLNNKGIVTHINLTGARLLGIDRKFVSRLGFSQFIDSDSEGTFLSARLKSVETGERQSIELALKREKRPSLWVRADIEAEQDGVGEVRQWRVVLVDISIQRQAEEDKKLIEDQLRQAQKIESIGTLAGGIAHEFNNILTIIIGNNEIVIEETPKWSSVQDNLEEIRIAGLRARDVVKQLLMFSRKEDARKEIIDLRTIVEESMKLIRSSTPKNINISYNMTENAAKIFGNATQISQLLINLCGNATDAMLDNNGYIEIEVKNILIGKKDKKIFPELHAGRYVELSVKDDGVGMDTKIIKRIFDPYFTTKDVGKGTGIGLAVVHGIVKSHNGGIYVESQPGAGTKFIIVFPRLECKIEKEIEEKIDLPTGHERILFVDDEDSILKLEKHRLEKLGYKVIGVTNPLKALAIFQKDPDSFDLVITDMAMPHMAGDQFVTEILNIRPKMPTMLCTGYSEKISKEKACEIGICSFAMKPLDKIDFAVSIRKVLDEAKERNQALLTDSSVL